MFKEYNDIAMDYELQPFLVVDEIAIVLEENLTEDDCNRLEQDDLARMALSGFIAGMLVSADLEISEWDNLGSGGNETLN